MKIGFDAFECCTSLERIKFPNTVKAIKIWTQRKCSGLTTVTLGDGLKENGLEEIEEEVFEVCT